MVTFGASSIRDTWDQWVSYTATSSTSITCAGGGVTANDPIFRVWVATAAATTAVNATFTQWVTAHERSCETRAQRGRREAAEKWASFCWAWDTIGRQAAKDQAKRRARKLLVEHLNAAQRESYEKHGYFVVEVNGTKYRIDQGTHGNVKELDKAGKPVFVYCIQPSGVPDEDAMLAQKLNLEANEASFKRVANRTPFRA